MFPFHFVRYICCCGCWLLAVGCWGCWLLVVGCRLFLFVVVGGGCCWLTRTLRTHSSHSVMLRRTVCFMPLFMQSRTMAIAVILSYHDSVGDQKASCRLQTDFSAFRRPTRSSVNGFAQCAHFHRLGFQSVQLCNLRCVPC